MSDQSISIMAYLVAAIFFILALKGLSSPVSARRGNIFGMLGMVIAVITTFWIGQHLIAMMILLPIVLGGLIGIVAAKKVHMTKMPELVALMHSFVGLAARASTEFS